MYWQVHIKCSAAYYPLAAILCKKGCVSPQQRRWWPAQDVPQCSWNFLSNRLLGGCSNILVKQTGSWPGWRGLPSGTNAGRCFQHSLQNGDSLTEKKRQCDERRNALLHTSAGDRVGLQSYRLPMYCWEGRGCKLSIPHGSERKFQSTDQPFFIAIIYCYFLMKLQSTNRACSRTCTPCLDFSPWALKKLYL